MAILTPNKIKASHWYTTDGAPAHQQRAANGNDRPTTITDAKRLHLLPSVTNILGILAKPQLEKWKINQAIQAAISHPIQKDEPLDYYCRRVVDASFQQVDDAADLGSKIHKALEQVLSGEGYNNIEVVVAGGKTLRLHAFVDPVVAWVKKTGIKVTGQEEQLVNLEHGFAGTTDVLFAYGKAGIGILDYKTKKTKPGEKVVAYDEHRLQLAAYAATRYGEAALDNVLAANIFISTTEPGRMEVCKHGNLRPDWEAFKLICGIWRYQKQYDPRVPATAGTVAGAC